MFNTHDCGGFSIRWFAAMLAIAVLAGTLAPQVASAQGAGDIFVAPTRIVFEGRERSAQLSLANKGSASATYRITVVNMAMDDTGKLSNIEKSAPGQNFAEDLFRYSPRQVTLAPGQTQAVRFLLRKPGGLAEGEYRSHVLLRAIPKEGGQSIEGPQATDGLRVRLIPIYGLSIPVIVRHGNLSATATLADLKVAPSENPDDPLPRLHFSIHREGNRSTFGDLTATFKPNGGGNALVVGQIMRLAVYTPNPLRKVEMALRAPEGVTLADGTLNLTYQTTEEEGAKPLTEAALNLP